VKREQTVTRDGWGVSTTSPVEKDGVSGVELHVYKFPYQDRVLLQKGDGYGKWFKNSEQAWKWALEHGYLQPFVHSWCPEHRTMHTFMGQRTGFCPLRVESEQLQAQYVPIWKVREHQKKQKAA
jgi:hypothetical protein